ncbi:MAG: FAD-binding oxidoreductase [Gammaproteobacteria bacterium]|nr:FAD-binding oxidoreductase [Gammaproteobacteria bacterium]
MTQLAYEQKKRDLIRQLQRDSGAIRLDKTTSNLFRTRAKPDDNKIDVRTLNQVLAVDSENQTVEVEGMTTYENLADACLARTCMPLVVPQLKSITIGGAVSGIGIESTSFRHGLPHESVLAMDVLLADGDVVTCTPDNEHADLFFGIPNSYGTLGYILKLTARTMPVKPYVVLQHLRHTDIEEYFGAVGEACASDVDFVDGSVFDGEEMYLTLGRFTDSAPYTSDYTWLKMYFRSIRERREDYLDLRDYLWRWDTDWFWCSKNLFVQNLPMRLLLGRRRLNSVTYQKVMRWNNRLGLTAAINRLMDRHPEGVVQDVDIPLENAAEFLRFFLDEIGIRPVWICPIGGHDPTRNFPLYPLHGSGLFINFGFWDIVPNPQKHEAGYFNRKIEAKVSELGGVKSLYSDAYYDEDVFWKLYAGDKYFALKQKYDPRGRLRDLYQKCVLRK